MDKQGRGEYLDESRIERSNQRPLENLQTETRAALQTVLGGSSMANATSFSQQVQLLQELKRYLNSFQERLEGVSNNYQQRVNDLHQAGMMDETYERYVSNELAETQMMISRLIEHISVNDIPTVDSEINFLSQKL